LLLEQAALIEHLSARVTELEATLKKPRKTSSNSHAPPSQDGPGRKNRKDDKEGGKKTPRPPRPGTSRALSDNPDKTERCIAEACPHGGTAVSAERQRCRHRYDHIELPEIRPVVTRIELFGGRCGGCGKRYRAEAPPGKPPGSPFGPGIRSFLLYLHHSHHVSFERLAGLSRDLFGLKISEGAITNIFQATTQAMENARSAIRERLVMAQVIASDETTTRVDGVPHWHWVFLSKDAVLHDIAPRRAKTVAETVLDGYRPEVWISDRYAGQQDLAGPSGLFGPCAPGCPIRHRLRRQRLRSPDPGSSPLGHPRRQATRELEGQHAESNCSPGWQKGVGQGCRL
jgi:transposase